MNDQSRLLRVILYCTLVNTAFMGARIDVPLLAIELGASTSLVGVLMSLFGLLPMLLATTVGRWIDAIGAGIPMMIGAGVLAASLVVAFLVAELWVLFPVAAISGLAFVSFNLASTAVAGTIGRPEDRTANFSWLAIAGGVANFAGAVATGHLIDAVGHARAFAVLAIAPAAVIGVIAMVRYTHTPRERAARAGTRGNLMSTLRHPGLARLLVISGVVGMSWDLYTFIIPVYGKRIGLSAGSIGNIMGAFGLAVLLVRTVVPALARLMSEWQMVVATLLLSALVFFAFPFANAPKFLMLLSFLYGIAFGAVQPVTTTLLFNGSPRGREGEVMGLRSTLQNALHVTMPAAFGVLSGLMGLLPIFWGTGALFAFTGWLAHARWGKRR